MKYFIIIACISLFSLGCEKPPSYSNVPIITFKSMSANTVRSFIDDNADAQYLSDTLQIQISFTDGNGAIGIPKNDTTDVDAFLVDSRANRYGIYDTTAFILPYVTPNGNIKAISGTISFTLSSELLGFNTAWDTLRYTIFIKDRNGNYSNTQTTPFIYIKDN